MSEEAGQLVAGYINPLAWQEVDEPWKSAIKSELTPQSALRFLCPPGIDSDIQNVAARYEKISIEAENRLFIVPAHDQVLEKIVWPLRFAKGAYALGNYLATVALCGTVMEMSAMLIFEMSDSYVSHRNEKRRLSIEDQKRLFGSTFEKLGQERRVEVLLALNLIDQDVKNHFDFVRGIRRKYMHFLSQDHSRVDVDARESFRRAIISVKSMLGLSIDPQGKLVLRPQVLKYLKQQTHSPDSSNSTDPST